MRRVVTRARLLALLLVVVGAVSGCGPGPGKTAAGVVVGVETAGREVRSFNLRTTEGEMRTFLVGTLEIDAAAFPASHLTEHALTSAPIAVAYRESAEGPVVYRMVDAPWAVPED